MPRPVVLAGVPLAVLTLATPALAGDMPNAADLSSQQQSRAISIRNLSGAKITQAHVQTSPDGRVWDIGHGAIETNQASEMVVPAHDCLANVKVQLDDGRTLQSTDLHSCNSTKIVVQKDAITIPQEAVPGAKQHGTPG